MRFQTNHIVLKDVADDLHRAMGGRVKQIDFDCAIGLHTIEPVRTSGRMLIGIQTEHILTPSGERGWVRFDLEVLKDRIRACDFVIDLSEHNRAYYEVLGLKTNNKVWFGPYVFPNSLPAFNQTETRSASFMGAMSGARNAGRRKRMQSYQELHDITVVPSAYGAEMDAQIRAHGFVANIHVKPQIYTEVPRLLKAYLNGTVLLSEPLAAPFISGRHYADITKPAPSLEERHQILTNLYEDMSAYRISPLIRKMHGRYLASQP